MNDFSADVAVVGLGPAGRAVAHRCSAAGLDVLALDPHPSRTWTPTYSAWADELPSWLPETAVASTALEPAVWTDRHRIIDRTYCVLDTSALQSTLALDRVQVLAGTAVDVTGSRVITSDGTIIDAGHVVDARGTFDSRDLAQQTAYGIVVERERAEPILEGADAWFMDWRTDNGASPGEAPSFLYAVALDDDRVLLEETCLVGRPALGLDVLRTRLHHRLSQRDLEPTGHEAVERVRFSVEPPPRSRVHTGRGGPVLFGSRSNLMHPATGYSVAASLASADHLVERFRDGGHPRRSRAVHIWTVQKLRNLGLRTALGLEPEMVPQFFSSFFSLPVELQRSYLSGHDDAIGTMTAMLKMFPTLPASARVAIARTIARPLHRA
ncbi:lycopene cyclase [Rhodococcus sp. 06-412-2C]|uniref:lycopene cyclase family protein n=1 Tax=unclassified Rhodococcus (in: high G+C Gram-positive bacteria) TaxID=192944 RepID=UPI000B9BA977|nr:MULTISPECIES: lycopene cyclase family protein [unclassified Rhodococcus (in: high G+C Gram-positive bacteria)]OZC81905.1 lycopene cyclase [Rhodococcus sp. 06-412-2C]OZC95869.1 lycopene cyclase [Rhodococcus sp. 06-412-2B]